MLSFFIGDDKMEELIRKAMSGKDPMALQLMVQNVLTIINNPNWKNYVDYQTYSDLVVFVNDYALAIGREYKFNKALRSREGKTEVEIPPEFVNDGPSYLEPYGDDVDYGDGSSSFGQHF